MANRGAPSKNVIYDSTTDTSSGRKRAVEFTGGVSVAERARLFGAQVNHTPVSKPTKSDNENHQRIRTNSANQNYSYSSTQRPPNNSRSAPPQNYDRPNRNEQPPPPSSSINSHDYSTVNRSHKQQQQPKATYQSVIYSTPQKSKHTKPSYTSVTPGESYTTDDEIYYESQRRRRRQQQQQQQQHQQAPPAYNSNYFQPIRDPLEVLYTQPSFGYSQPSLTNNDNMQPFDLSNLIGRIQQDYVNNARPYVSSIQFIENPQIPSTGNRTTNDLYLRPGASYQYDVIDTSKLLSTYMRPVPTQNQHRRSHHHHHSSSRRRQNRGHYRDCASSPIDIVEKQKTPSPPPKPPTPIEEKPETSEETDEEETVNTKTEEKTAEDETSEEEEDEEEEKKPAIAVPPTIATRPPLITVPSVTQNESSSSESEESESDSDSDSDDSDDSDKGKSKRKKKGKPPIVPAPAPARINARTTPQLNSRGATQPATPTMKVVTNKTDDPPEVSSSVKSFNTQEPTKSPGIRGKFSLLASKFRRKKS